MGSLFFILAMSTVVHFVHSAGCMVTSLMETGAETICMLDDVAYAYAGTWPAQLSNGTECTLNCPDPNSEITQTVNCTGNEWQPSPNICPERISANTVTGAVEEVLSACTIFCEGEMTETSTDSEEEGTTSCSPPPEIDHGSLYCTMGTSNRTRQCALECDAGWLAEPFTDIIPCSLTEEGVWLIAGPKPVCKQVQLPQALQLNTSVVYHNLPCTADAASTLKKRIETVIGKSSCVINGTCDATYTLSQCPLDAQNMTVPETTLVLTENITFTNKSLHDDVGKFKPDAANSLPGWLSAVRALERYGKYINASIREGKMDVNVSGVVYAADPAMASFQGLVACPGGTESKHALCVTCGPGSYEEGGLCRPCMTGYYQDLPGQTVCRACPAGTLTGVLGAASRLACLKDSTRADIRHYKDPIILCAILVIVGVVLFASMLAIFLNQRKSTHSYSMDKAAEPDQEKYYPPQ